MSNSKKVDVPPLTPDERAKLLRGLFNVAAALRQAKLDNAFRWLLLRAIQPLQSEEAAFQRANSRRRETPPTTGG